MKMFSKLIKLRYNAGEENNILGLDSQGLWTWRDTLLLLIILDIMLRYAGILL